MQAFDRKLAMSLQSSHYGEKYLNGSSEIWHFFIFAKCFLALAESVRMESYASMKIRANTLMECSWFKSVFINP